MKNMNQKLPLFLLGRSKILTFKSFGHTLHLMSSVTKPYSDIANSCSNSISTGSLSRASFIFLTFAFNHSFSSTKTKRNGQNARANQLLKEYTAGLFKIVVNNELRAWHSVKHRLTGQHFKEWFNTNIKP